MAREVTLVDAGLGNIASVERALIQVGAAVTVTGDADAVAKARMVVFPGQSAFGAATQAIVDGAMGAALKMVIGRGDPFLGICLGMQLLFDSSEENGGQEGLHVMPGRCTRFPEAMTEEAEAGEVDESVVRPAEASADTAHAQTEFRPGAPSPSSAPSTLEVAGATGTQLEPVSGSFVAEHRPAAPAGGAPVDPSAVTLVEPVAGPVGDATARRLNTAGAPRRRRLKVPHTGWNEVEPTGSHYYFVHSYYVEAERSEDVMWMTTYGGIRFAAAVRRGNLLGCQFHPEKSQRAGLRFLRAFMLGGWT